MNEFINCLQLSMSSWPECLWELVDLGFWRLGLVVVIGKSKINAFRVDFYVTPVLGEYADKTASWELVTLKKPLLEKYRRFLYHSMLNMRIAHRSWGNTSSTDVYVLTAPVSSFLRCSFFRFQLSQTHIICLLENSWRHHLNIHRGRQRFA